MNSEKRKGLSKHKEARILPPPSLITDEDTSPGEIAFLRIFHTPSSMQSVMIVYGLIVGYELLVKFFIGYRGLINQFLGDGFMPTFGAPLSYGNDCRNAVEAAREIIARLKQENENGSILPTRVGIGIHAGEVVTGNVDSALRKQYSITGNTVMVVARIEQLNKQYQSQLLISEEVWKAIGGAEDAVHLGLVQVKGEERPVSLYVLAQ